MFILRITGGSLRGRTVKSVPDPRTRYTSSMVRQAVFSMVHVEGKSFLELFCGSAVVSLEAISRGARDVTAVDISPKALATAAKNAEICGVTLKTIKSDFRAFLKNCFEEYDIVFADPPYNVGYVDELLRFLAAKPSVGKLIIVEKAVKETYLIPDAFELTKLKKYGDTEIILLHRKIV